MRNTTAWITLTAAALAAAACDRRSDADGAQLTSQDGGVQGTPLIEQKLHVESPVFEDGGMIPERYAADGQNVSPPLSWSQGPKGTLGYALVMDDPDAMSGTWVHWVVWNIPTTQLDESPPLTAMGAVQGRNSMQKNAYSGPLPPSGTHRYYFHVYALDVQIPLAASADRAALDEAMRGHKLAYGELVGRYSAKR